MTPIRSLKWTCQIPRSTAADFALPLAAKCPSGAIPPSPVPYVNPDGPGPVHMPHPFPCGTPTTPKGPCVRAVVQPLGPGCAPPLPIPVIRTPALSETGGWSPTRNGCHAPRHPRNAGANAPSPSARKSRKEGSRGAGGGGAGRGGYIPANRHNASIILRDVLGVSNGCDDFCSPQRSPRRTGSGGGRIGMRRVRGGTCAARARRARLSGGSFHGRPDDSPFPFPTSQCALATLARLPRVAPVVVPRAHAAWSAPRVQTLADRTPEACTESQCHRQTNESTWGGLRPVRLLRGCGQALETAGDGPQTRSRGAGHTGLVREVHGAIVLKRLREGLLLLRRPGPQEQPEQWPGEARHRHAKRQQCVEGSTSAMEVTHGGSVRGGGVWVGGGGQSVTNAPTYFWGD